jgi:hypothetical protein
MAKVYEIDPIEDERWAPFLERHPAASIFHTAEWLAALQQTYGYRPRAVTTSAPGEQLTNGLVFCRVRSWATGARLVSVPFSDHCTPLVETEDVLACLLSALESECDRGAEKYLEIRSVDAGRGGMVDSASYCLHRIDLRPSPGELFHGLHESCVRRKIQRAEREGVACKSGTSDELLRNFYGLMVITRRRHGIPPQPFFWFRNLIVCLGQSAKIHVASFGCRPVAGILAIRYKTTITYKYGCSDVRFHKTGAMQRLMWQVIRGAKDDGLLTFDMGRTDWEDKGLLAFKDRWGAERSTLRYLRYPASAGFHANKLCGRVAKGIFSVIPASLLIGMGRVIYRHID